MGDGSVRVMQIEKMWEDVASHCFWKKGKTSIFDVCIVNLKSGYYMRMIPKKALAKEEK